MSYDDEIEYLFQHVSKEWLSQDQQDTRYVQRKVSVESAEDGYLNLTAEFSINDITFFDFLRSEESLNAHVELLIALRDKIVDHVHDLTEAWEIYQAKLEQNAKENPTIP